MAAETNEPRALSAALANPTFATRTGGAAVHSANRHVERWAPEAGAHRVRSLRNLGFVDRLVSPWLEAAQRSASMRLFSQVHSNGLPERQTAQTSWVFPRPWYQDELDWMAAARESAAQRAMGESPARDLFTTRGTYVAPAQQSQVALPAALYEYVAPSLSVAPPQRGDVGAPSIHSNDAYSPLVSLASVHAAHVMQRAVAPLVGSDVASAARMSPNLRAVLTTMLERSANPAAAAPELRIAGAAPELVTPPAPRPDAPRIAGDAMAASFTQSNRHISEDQVVSDMTAQRAQIVELQRAARAVAARELAEKTPTPAPVAQPPQAQSQSQSVEARVAQRVADQQREQREVAEQREQLLRATQERVGRDREQRLHEQARDAAARDARLAERSPDPTPATREAPGTLASRPVPQEIVAALANLSPELATAVASGLAQRPDRAVQAISELGEALRTIELIAHTSAAGNSFETARGPRLVMPAGLGGLVATVDRNVAQSELRARAPLADVMMQAPAAPQTQVAARAQTMSRVPAMPWLVSQAPRTGAAPTTALGATEAATPAALHHVAWADRWLARFAGARGPSLDLLTASSAATSDERFQAFASAAPGMVFVAPQFDGATAKLETERATPITPPAPPPLRRYDDNEETPDDVFMAISAAATRARSPVTAPAAPPVERDSLADAVAHAVPSAPGAGLSAQLASSPFAPAFRHVFPLAAAPSFDVRSLFGSGLSVAYLAGLLAPATGELIAGAARGADPTWIGATGATGVEPPTREVADWWPTYVSPTEATAPQGDQVTDDAQPVTQQAAQQAAPLTTMRSALLSWDVEAFAAAPDSRDQMRVGAPAITNDLGLEPSARAHHLTGGSAMADSMIRSMTMPMMGETGMTREPGSLELSGMQQHVPAFAAPGMIADRAHSWSVAQERSSSDLSFDFVTPELVLAARVYGLGPAEAAQAMRLAIAGPGQLATMASTVDRTFVQALAIEAERRDRVQHAQQTITAYPPSATQAQQAAPSRLGGDAPSVDYVAPRAAAPGTLAPTTAAAIAASTGSTFGVDRRQPRGAFMWPAATIAALGLTAAAPDGDHSMSVAALELLAAQSVAELGTYAALGFGPAPVAETTTTPAESRTETTTVARTSAEPAEPDVISAATALVPAARRAKFEAMYVALGQSQNARSWSPAARAARALALAGRGDDNITAYERAQVAWDVLPLVAPTAAMAMGFGDDDRPGATMSTGTAAQRAAQRATATMIAGGPAARARFDLPEYVESRPGLAGLSARAGEALTSYVSPVQAAPAQPSRETPAMRAPTAAQEMVRTGRPAAGGSGRFGGGEVEIPTWFEAAARKMLEERSGGVSDGISLAELTLVSAAPSQQIAASTRGVPSAAPANPNPSAQGAAANAAQQVDIEKVANEVYKHILTLMDAARFRNGEPYL